MASEYLCPEEHSFYCSGKGCVLNEAACDPEVNAISKPGYKIITENPGMPVIQSPDEMKAQEFLNNLSNVRFKSHDSNNDVIRFCAEMYNHCLWVKMFLYSQEKDSAYACFINEEAFFNKTLSTYTPHIVQRATSLIKNTNDIQYVQDTYKEDINKVILKIKTLTKNKQDLFCVFYKQPEKWVYLESFMDVSKFIVTQEMLISIIFQIVYTIACLQSKKYIHGNLHKENTIALDLRPKEKTITYYKNSVTFIVPINIKVIVLNWEDVTKGDSNSDIVTVCGHFEKLLSKLNHPDINNLNTFLNEGKINGSADNLLENDIFKRFKQYSFKK